MPGRVSASARQRESVASRKSSTQTLKSARSSTDIPDEGDITHLRRAICQVFSDAQKTTAGHRKLVISLRKIQEACAYEPVNNKKGRADEDFDEEDFNAEVVRCVLRVLAVRKAEPVGDRVVRFLGSFLQVANQKDNEITDQEDPEATTLPETPSSRLTTSILSTLLPLLTVKEKTIRFRATQVTSHIINSLDTLDDNLFHLLRLALLKRIHDKEAPVRLQAVYGLGRLATEAVDEGDTSDSDSDGVAGGGVLAKLLNVLQNDPSADVRRNLLLNLPLTKEVLPYLLERARDSDGATRRALYARLLPALGDFRHLSLTHREKLLRWGLRDRDENVRKATARLFCERWIEDCAALPAVQVDEADAENGQPKPNGQAADPSLDALLELLERIDVVNSGVEGGIAQIAMREFWQGRPDYVDYVSFPDTFWEDLSPELAFVARSFNDHCRAPRSGDGNLGPRALDALLEEKLPEVTRFGYLLEREINRLLGAARAAASGEDEEAEEESVQREFVVEQMLHMALTFDYSDEVGRRKMFGLMREALTLPELPEEATRLVVEVFRLVCGEDARAENDFCRVVMEAVAEVHDTIVGDVPDCASEDDSFHSAPSELSNGSDAIAVDSKQVRKAGKDHASESDEAAEERAIRELMVNMKCLHIAQCVLQNVQCNLEDCAHLVTMLNNLVVPAVRSDDNPIRERGLVCLGLCCLLDKNLAEENITLFLHCFAKGHPALQTISLQIIADILVTHPTLLAETSTNPDTTTATSAEQGDENPLVRPVLKAFSKSLKSSNAVVQSTGATALSKTMLSRLVTDTDLLKQLVIAYFDPDTAANTQLRQGLSYFLPVYCHSRADNASRMAIIACATLSKLATLREAYLDNADVADEEDEMVTLTTIANMIVDWTDPRKIVGFAEATAAGSNAAKADASAANQVHLVLAESILDRLVTSQIGKEERKVLFGMLSKLHLPAEGCDGEQLKGVLELVVECVDSKVANDVSSKNTLAKLQNHLLKLMHDIASDERGAGGDESALEATEIVEPPVRRNVSDDEVQNSEVTELTGDMMHSFDEEATTQLHPELKDTTIGVPDAEGTKVQLGEDEDGDTEMTGFTEDE